MPGQRRIAPEDRLVEGACVEIPAPDLQRPAEIGHQAYRLTASRRRKLRKDPQPVLVERGRKARVRGLQTPGLNSVATGTGGEELFFRRERRVGPGFP